MARLFGTDGVRGLANRDITAELALGLGQAAARVLGEGRPDTSRRPRAVIGRDTRISGEFLDAAVAAGLASAGVDVTQVGVLPTPGVAHLSATTDVDLGVVISASHNPMQDNGIKFFARTGFKLPDEVEDRIEAALSQEWDRPIGEGVGVIEAGVETSHQNYVEHLVSVAGSLAGLRIAVDCANGAASEVAPSALREAGADVVVLNASPDGRNINDRCGSTHPEQLQAAVLAAEADFGVAYDGDADRCLAVDHTGTLVDGDQILGILALAFRDEGRLANDTLVATVMSNLGLKIAMREEGIAMVETGVGDRYVLEAMLAGGHALGGEQSGHIIDLRNATTGDGTLTSILLAARVHATGRRLADLADVVHRLPQILVNVPGVDKARASSDAELLAAVTAAEAELGDGGRVLLRPSGTEPLVRVMVEAQTQEHAEQVAGRLAEVVRERLAL